jgi:uncharacterized membrane protein YebE (DUF533 family)
MFDARSLLETIMRGAAPQQQAQGGGLGGLGDLLGKMMQGQGAAPQAQAGQPAQGGGMPGGIGGLEDMLRKMMPQAGQQPAGQSGQGGGGLADILGKLGGAQGGQSGQQGGGGLMDILGQVLGQATSGVKEGARRVEGATGIGQRSSEAFGQATGQTPEQMLEKIKELIAQNKLGAGAAAGGLGAVVLGTRTGRSLAANAAKLGGLALIGGLAYKAYLNYSQGRPLISGPDGGIAAAPSGSGFESAAVTNESAMLYIQGMVAAAAADGRIDPAEQQKIMGGLQQAGVGSQAEEFMAQLLNSPPSIDDLANAVRSQEEAIQLFTAARVAVDVDNHAEHDFLINLASRLGMDDGLVQHIDAAARGNA